MRLIVTTIILMMLSYTASAQTVMYCRGIKGKTIYAEEGRWLDDGGSIRLDLVLNNEQLDISIDDLAGPTTIRWMGGEIFFLVTKPAKQHFWLPMEAANQSYTHTIFSITKFTFPNTAPLEQYKNLRVMWGTAPNRSLIHF